MAPVHVPPRMGKTRYLKKDEAGSEGGRRKKQKGETKVKVTVKWRACVTHMKGILQRTGWGRQQLLFKGLDAKKEEVLLGKKKKRSTGFKNFRGDKTPCREKLNGNRC